MHPQMERLIAFAQEKLGLTTPSEIARALNVSQQALKNWEARGISNEGLLLAGEMWGVSPLWLKNGTGEIADHNTPNRATKQNKFSSEELAELVSLFIGSDEAGRASILSMARAQFEESQITDVVADNKRQRRK